MPYFAMNPQRLLRTSVGNGQCVAFARAAASMPHTASWRRGAPVRGAAIAVGTAIATFDTNGRYANDTHGRSHAAICLGQDAVGIQVLDQWVELSTKRTVQLSGTSRMSTNGRFTLAPPRNL